MLQSMGSQRVGHNLVSEQNITYPAWASHRVGTQWVINLSLSLSVSLSASVCLSLLHTRGHTLQVPLQYNNKL